MKDVILIFDFDGTIADTHQYIVEISNRLSQEYDYKFIYPHEIEALKDKTSQEVIGILRVPVFKIPKLLARAKKEFKRGLENLQVIEGLKIVLTRLKKENFTLGILSSNAEENIRSFLKNQNLDIFNFVHATSMVWSKHRSLKKLIEANDFDKDKIYYIGDETRDIDAAKRLGLKIIAVTWGYNSTQALKARRPNYLVHEPEELYRLCRELALKSTK